MSASFTLTLDTTPPANPALLLNSGAATTGDRVVALDLSTDSTDVFEMKVWGDVDPAADIAIQVLEADSMWVSYDADLMMRLSTGTGRKYVYAKLRDDVGNVTVQFQDFIDYDPTVPVVTVTTAVDRSRISRIASFDAATFIWESSVAFISYEVRVVPSHGSPHQAGVLVPSTVSTNVSGSGSFLAHTPITTTIRGVDLQIASPGDTTKIVKVFVQTSTGWSS